MRNYWRDNDTALFILKHLYRNIPEEPSSPDEPIEGSSKKESGLEGWSHERDPTDEEIPLTFAERTLVKKFSRKTKRIMKG
ncbi:unnamed protein product [Ilex paraguariensis]|uniref:DDHD domain-containing protein n=1 Tax=Ilex paraguariensis TaxID=185542 RepID=A0ABC8SVT0_9AQUA